MPVFTALMSSAFGADDPFAELARNDREYEGEDVHILPVWVAESLERDMQHGRIAQ